MKYGLDNSIMRVTVHWDNADSASAGFAFRPVSVFERAAFAPFGLVVFDDESEELDSVTGVKVYPWSTINYVEIGSA